MYFDHNLVGGWIVPFYAEISGQELCITCLIISYNCCNCIQLLHSLYNSMQANFVWHITDF